MIEIIHTFIPLGVAVVVYLAKIDRGVVRLNGSIAHTIKDLDAHKEENREDFRELRAHPVARE